MVEREGKGEPATAHCIFEIGSFHASIICQNNQIEQANQICRVFALFIQSHLSKQFSRRLLQLCDSVSVSSKQKHQKKSQRGRKPAATGQTEELCRICKCSLKTKYGSLGTFVNVFKPCVRGKLYEMLPRWHTRDIEFHKNTALSSRICSSCCRKLYKYCELFEF